MGRAKVSYLNVKSQNIYSRHVYCAKMLTSKLSTVPGAGEGGGGTYYVRVARDVPPKGVQFSESVWDGGIFYCPNSGKGLKYTCLKRGPCLPGKGLLSYLCLELK